ncbi:MAG: MFS transporter [Bacteroidota bacterium]
MESFARDKASFTPSYKQYVLLALTGVYIFNFIDRQILVILQESIKEELQVLDWQIGLLTGFAFAVFYVTMGLPIARWADQSSRRNIITLALAFWSTMTALCGVAANFTQLLLARIGVGIGEAGGSPPAHSMISDYFPKERRATALSIYSMGIYGGILFGYLFGGWLNQYFGWRNTLLVLGIPGILYAIFFRFTVKEPPRGYSEAFVSESPLPTMKQVFRVLASRRAFLFLAVGAGLHTFVTYGVGNWFPSFLSRMHGMESGEIGTWLALASGLGGGIGTFLGGYLGDRFGQIDRRWYLWIPGIAIAISIPITLYSLYAANQYAAVISLLFSRLCWGTYLGPCLAMTHGLVSLRMRALASAIFFFVLNFLGLGLGPMCFGALSDLLHAEFGIEALRYALSFSALVSCVSIVCFWQGSRTLNADLDNAPV